MINAGRNFLINIAPATNIVNTDTAGEYIPPEYSVKPITDRGITLIRNILFGSHPDLRFRNLRARELLNAIHQTELEDYLFALDTRITYPTKKTIGWSPELRQEIIVKQASGPKIVASVIGLPTADNNHGRALYNFIAGLGKSNDAPIGIITTIGETPRGGSAFELKQRGTSFGALPKTALKFAVEFSAQTIANNYILSEDDEQILGEYFGGTFPIISEEEGDPPEEPTPGIPDISAIPALSDLDETIARWLITVKANPAPAITTVLPLIELLGETPTTSLFGFAPKEPYLTFKNMWFDHYSPVHRLAALSMALIYRTAGIN